MMFTYRIFFLLVVVAVGGSHGLVKLHKAVEPVDDGNRYVIAVEYNKGFDEVDEKLSELASNNDTLEYTVLWRIPVGLKFICVQMNKAALNAIREFDEDLAYIEQDGWLTIQSNAASKNDTSKEEDKPKKDGQPTEQWGLDRIDQRNQPLDGVFSVKPNAGTGASIYIVGTGVHVKHEEFGGRASNIYDYRGEDNNGRDCNGHGTHMASLAAGKTYGVAKNATIYGVRITRCRGSGKLSDAVKAMEWLSQNVQKPGVAVIGVGSTGASPSLDNAIHRIYLAGCMVVVPAGNNNSLACDSSPGRMSLPITVGAMTKSDYAVYYSNHGSCAEIFAPGMGVEGACYDGTNTCVDTSSGTSMASAYVTGAVAMHMGNGMPPFKIKAYLLRHATEYNLHQVEDDTPNKLLYVGKVRSGDDYKRVVGQKKPSKKDDEKKKDEKKDEKKEEKKDEKKEDKKKDEKKKEGDNETGSSSTGKQKTEL